MSGEIPAPTDHPPQPAAAQHNYLVRCLNGWEIKVATPLELIPFRHFAKANGFIAADKMLIEFEHVVSIEYIGPYVPGAVVSPFTGRPAPQLVQT